MYSIPNCSYESHEVNKIINVLGISSNYFCIIYIPYCSRFYCLGLHRSCYLEGGNQNDDAGVDRNIMKIW